MKKYIGKFSFVVLIISILSLTSQQIFAATLVDPNKAYNICMKYHPPRIQGLCSQITSQTTFEDILGEHNRGGYYEVINEKPNMIPTPKPKVTPKKTTPKKVTQPVQKKSVEKAQTKVSPNVKAEENKILTFAYSSFFWKIVNIVLVTFFVITYLFDRYKYFKRKKKQNKPRK